MCHRKKAVFCREWGVGGYEDWVTEEFGNKDDKIKTSSFTWDCWILGHLECRSWKHREKVGGNWYLELQSNRWPRSPGLRVVGMWEVAQTVKRELACPVKRQTGPSIGEHQHVKSYGKKLPFLRNLIIYFTDWLHKCLFFLKHSIFFPNKTAIVEQILSIPFPQWGLTKWVKMRLSPWIPNAKYQWRAHR